MDHKGTREQRRQRSEETVQAITYQLQYVLDNYEIDLILLADHHGLVIASAGDDEAAEIFAALADTLDGGAELDPVLAEAIPGLAKEQIICETLSLEELPLHLCAIMKPNVDNCMGFERARTGIQRIYKTTGHLANES